MIAPFLSIIEQFFVAVFRRNVEKETVSSKKEIVKTFNHLTKFLSLTKTDISLTIAMAFNRKDTCASEYNADTRTRTRESAVFEITKRYR